MQNQQLKNAYEKIVQNHLEDRVVEKVTVSSARIRVFYDMKNKLIRHSKFEVSVNYIVNAFIFTHQTPATSKDVWVG